MPCTNSVTIHRANPVNAARSRKGPMLFRSCHRARTHGGAVSVQVVETLRITPADLFASLLADVGAGSQMLGALRPFAVPVRVIAGEHDEVGAQYVDHAGQDRFLRLTRHPDVAFGQIIVWIAAPAPLDPVAAFLVMLMQTVDEERDPARARLEEGDPQLRVALEHTAGHQRGHRRHLVERKTDAVHLNVVGEPVYTDLR